MGVVRSLMKAATVPCTRCGLGDGLSRMSSKPGLALVDAVAVAGLGFSCPSEEHGLVGECSLKQLARKPCSPSPLAREGISIADWS
jgi:hypothetical protein